MYFVLVDCEPPLFLAKTPHTLKAFRPKPCRGEDTSKQQDKHDGLSRLRLVAQQASHKSRP